MSVLTEAGEATPEWLTQALHRAGVLDGERVVAVARRANPAFNSSVTHLAPTYDRAPAGAPPSLVLKLNRDGWGEAEAGLYQLAMRDAGALPMLVRCYDAAYDPSSGTSHCLLLDVSATHRPPVTRERVLALDGVPRPDQLDAMVDAVADLHAYWWEHPDFGSGVLVPPSGLRDAPARATRIREREEQFRRFVDAAGETVGADVLRLCERALAGLAGQWERYYGPRFRDLRRVTVVNGDCYFTQFLCSDEAGDCAQEVGRKEPSPQPSPRGRGSQIRHVSEQMRAPVAGEPPVYLVDFQEASVHLPAEDLAFMFATFWTSEQRAEEDREMRMMRRYHARLRERLAARGAAGYDWDTLLDDYRVSIVYMLFRTIWDQTNGSPEAYWRPKLACVVASFRDHDCAALMGPA